MGPATAPIQLPPHTPREGGGGGPKDTAREKGKEDSSSNYPGGILERLRKKLREEIHKEDRGIIKLRKKIQKREIYFGGGAKVEYRAAHREIILRDEEYRMEREGLVLGLERAIDIIDLVEEEQGRQVPPPQSNPHPEHPASGGFPQDCQKIEEDEEVPADG